MIMKKKYLLAIIPALLVLSGCQCFKQAKTDNNLFLEDTLAHEEMFKDVSFSQQRIGIRKIITPDPVEHPDSEDIAIGIQSKTDGDKIAFRFVAAVRIEEANLVSTVAKWTRTISDGEGGDPIKTTAEIPCTTVYTSLSTDGDPYTIDMYNEAHGGTNYNYFVVYTIYNIPDDGYNDDILCAYLTLSEGTTLKSKAVATTIDQSLKIAFNSSKEYFLAGTIGGHNNSVVLCDSDTDNPENNSASFVGNSFLKYDNFEIFKNENTKLIKYGYSSKGVDAENFDYYFDDNGSISVKYDGDYNFYFTKGSKIYYGCDRVVRKIHISTSGVSWFANDGYKAALYAFGGSLGAAWLELVDNGSGNYTTADEIDSSEYRDFIVGRCAPAKFNSVGGFGDITNQTGNVEGIRATPNDLIELSGDMGHTAKIYSE